MKRFIRFDGSINQISLQIWLRKWPIRTVFVELRCTYKYSSTYFQPFSQRYIAGFSENKVRKEHLRPQVVYVSVLNSIGWELDKQKISRAEKAEQKLRTLYTSYTPSYSHQHLSCLTTQRRLHTSHVMLKSRSGVVRDCRNLQPFAKLSR